MRSLHAFEPHVKQRKQEKILTIQLIDLSKEEEEKSNEDDDFALKLSKKDEHESIKRE